MKEFDKILIKLKWNPIIMVRDFFINLTVMYLKICIQIQY